MSIYLSNYLSIYVIVSMLAYFPEVPSAVLIRRAGDEENNLHGPKIEIE